MAASPDWQTTEEYPIPSDRISADVTDSLSGLTRSLCFRIVRSMSEQPPTIEDLARKVEVLSAMLHPIGRGLSSVMDVLGLDHADACADLDDERVQMAKHD